MSQNGFNTNANTTTTTTTTTTNNNNNNTELNAWLQVGELFPETTGLAKDIQDHVISISNCKKLHFGGFHYCQRQLQ